jgi:hypothetical protein
MVIDDFDRGVSVPHLPPLTLKPTNTPARNTNTKANIV